MMKKQEIGNANEPTYETIQWDLAEHTRAFRWISEHFLSHIGHDEGRVYRVCSNLNTANLILDLPRVSKNETRKGG